MQLDPPDLIDRAAESEGWDRVAWNRWVTLRAQLEKLGVTRMKLDGPSLLITELPGRFASAMIRDSVLDAVQEIVLKLTPPVLRQIRVKSSLS